MGPARPRDTLRVELNGLSSGRRNSLIVARAATVKLRPNDEHTVVNRACPAESSSLRLDRGSNHAAAIGNAGRTRASGRCTHQQTDVCRWERSRRSHVSLRATLGHIAYGITNPTGDWKPLRAKHRSVAPFATTRLPCSVAHTVDDFGHTRRRPHWTNSNPSRHWTPDSNSQRV